jgi:hypothetical protein
MNLENFAEYLKYPSRLYQLPYEELKSLTMQYPYCANFHVLLLIKSKLEAHPDLEKNLARAATYSVDRKYLRKIMLEEALIPAESQITIGEDEVLELKDLFTLDENWEKVPVEQTSEETENGAAHLAFDFPGTPTDELEETELDLPGMNEGENSEEDPFDQTPAESFSEEKEIFVTPDTLPIVAEDVIDHADAGIPDAAASDHPYQIPEGLIPDLAAVVGISQEWDTSRPALPAAETTRSAPATLPGELVDDCVAVSLLLQDWWEKKENTAVLEWEVPAASSRPAPVAKAKKTIAPTPKSRFQSYKKQYRRPLQKGTTSAPEPVAVEKKMPGARKVAEESLREDLGVASETLAGILVQQHQYDRAIKMYEHLSLLIPEKNTYFAAKIDAIKKL